MHYYRTMHYNNLVAPLCDSPPWSSINMLALYPTTLMAVIVRMWWTGWWWRHDTTFGKANAYDLTSIISDINLESTTRSSMLSNNNDPIALATRADHSLALSLILPPLAGLVQRCLTIRNPLGFRCWSLKAHLMYICIKCFKHRLFYACLKHVWFKTCK